MTFRAKAENTPANSQSTIRVTRGLPEQAGQPVGGLPPDPRDIGTISARDED